jgi:hypothetical protein
MEEYVGQALFTTAKANRTGERRRTSISALPSCKGHNARRETIQISRDCVAIDKHNHITFSEACTGVSATRDCLPGSSIVYRDDISMGFSY